MGDKPFQIYQRPKVPYAPSARYDLDTVSRCGLGGLMPSLNCLLLLSIGSM